MAFFLSPHRGDMVTHASDCLSNKVSIGTGFREYRGNDIREGPLGLLQDSVAASKHNAWLSTWAVPALVML